MNVRSMCGGVVVLVAVCLSTGQAQFKTKADRPASTSSSLIRTDESGLMFGWFDPSRFSMRQSYSLSYSSFGGRGLSVGEYTNTMAYQISDPLSVRFDVSLTHVPYSGFGNKLGQDMSGLRLSRAELNYRPSENTLFSIQFQQIPATSFLRGWDTGLGLQRSEELLR